MLNVVSDKIYFVHGIFGWGPKELPISYWGDALEQFDNERFDRREIKCGPVSSFHDRACELYAQIKGGDFIYDPPRVGGPNENFGPKRARVQRSERNLENTPPLHPHWSEESPIILVAHSAGAQTCLTLQRLLAEKFWDDSNNADWIEAIICVAGVINGSTLTYMFGCDPSEGTLRALPEHIIGAVVELAKTISGAGKPLPQPWLEHWKDRDAFVTGTDNLAYDLTLKGCLEANQRFKTNANTYYLSLVTGMLARPPIFGSLPFPLNAVEFPDMNSLLTLSAAYQSGRDDFDVNAKPIPNWGEASNLAIGDWLENDGAVSRISQRFPFIHDAHASGKEASIVAHAPIEKGKWYFKHVEDIVGVPFDHLDPVFGPSFNKPRNLQAHQLLYQRLNSFFCAAR